MGERPRIVIDTNVLVSQLLPPYSLPAQAVRHATDHGRPLVSEATLTELADVLARPKCDAYLSVAERQQFLVLFMRIAEKVAVLRPVQACRDPRDNRLLEVAVNGAPPV